MRRANRAPAQAARHPLALAVRNMLAALAAPAMAAPEEGAAVDRTERVGMEESPILTSLIISDRAEAAAEAAVAMARTADHMSHYTEEAAVLAEAEVTTMRASEVEPAVRIPV